MKQRLSTSDGEPPLQKSHTVDEHKHVRDKLKEFAAKHGIKMGLRRRVIERKP